MTVKNPRLVRALAVGLGLWIVVVAVGACDVKVGEGGLSVGISGGKASDEWSRTYTVAAGGRFEIANLNGPIEAAAATGGTLEVRAFREVQDQSDETARARLQGLRMVEDISPDRVSIRVDAKDGDRFGLFGRPRVVIRYRVRVPAGLDVVLKTTNGNVSLENLQGRVTAATVNGVVTGVALSGALDASAVNGSVRVDLAAVEGDVRLSAVNGAVRLELPQGVNADLEVGAVNGGVSVDERVGLTGATQGSGGQGFGRPPQRVAGRLGAGGHRISAQTTNGGVRVTVRGQGGAQR